MNHRITMILIFPLAVILCLLQYDVQAKSNSGKAQRQPSQIFVQNVLPVPRNLDIPPGPQSGRFFLTGGKSGFSNGVHDLGLIKKNQDVTIYVERITSALDLTVIIITPDWARNDVLVFGADDNEDDPDPAFSFTAPVSGNYTMLVADYNKKAGWYRFRMDIE